MADRELIEQARALLDLCRKKKLKIAAAESCTGGLVAATLTEIAGSSDVFERGFVTYSNEAKQAMLGVPPEVLASHGAVIRETAQAMVKGALAHAPVDLAVSITGIAGPGGAVAGKLGKNLVISVRNHGMGRDNAGEAVKSLFSEIGSAGGHRNMAKAVIPIRVWRRREGTARDLPIESRLRFVCGKFGTCYRRGSDRVSIDSSSYSRASLTLLYRFSPVISRPNQRGGLNRRQLAWFGNSTSATTKPWLRP